MNALKNSQLLQGVLDQDAIDKIEFGAKYYERMGRIGFKIIEIAPGRHITVRVSQGKNPSGNYLIDKELIERGKELFAPFTDLKINVHPVPYTDAPVEVVTPEWIKDNMHRHSIPLKHLVRDTGIDKSSLSALINGLKPLSQCMKGLFYYYFKLKEG